MSEERILAACPDVLDCTVVAVRDGGRVVTDVLLLLAAGASDRDRPPGSRSRRAGPVRRATLRDVMVVADRRSPPAPTGKVRKLVLRERHLAATEAAPDA